MSAPPTERGRFSFEAASKDPLYLAVNKAFVNDTLNVKPHAFIVDIGSGTGLITRLIRDRYSGVPAHIIGLEPNPASLEVARKNVTSIGATVVDFQEADARDILQHVSPGTVHRAYMGNDIHELNHYGVLDETLHAIAIALDRDGVFAFNTTFVKDAMPSVEYAAPLGKWVVEAQNLVGAKKPSPTEIVPQTTEKPFEILPLDNYLNRVREAGLEIAQAYPREVLLTSSLLRAIAQYDTFIKGAWRYPVPPESVPDGDEPYEVRLMQTQSNALIRAIDILEQKHNDEAQSKGQTPTPFTIKRRWLEVIAKKPLAQAA